MKINCAHDQMVPIGQLKRHPKNRNKHPQEQLIRLAQILDYQGWRYPVKVSRRSGHVTSGHGRIEAARLNGWTEIPVNFQDYDSDEQEYADVQSDNAIASWSELDLGAINIDLADLGPDFNIDLLGIEGFVLEPTEKLEPQCDEDEVPEDVEPKTKPGDIYQLGRHRLMCGDASATSSIDELMDGEEPDLISTDPPYGMDLETDRRGMGNTTTNYKKVAGDSEPFDPQSILGAFPHTPKILWGADYYCHRIPNWSEGSPVVWAKAHSEDENKVWGSSFETAWVWPKKKRLLWFIRRIHMGDEHEGTHPTQKPTEITTRAIDFFDVPEHGIVVDLFGGSGSTLIACEKTNRRCFMMELDPHYCDVIVARWEKYTGKTAEMVNEEAATAEAGG
jgi:DNA modification methylase